MIHAEVSEAKRFPKRRGDEAMFAFAAFALDILEGPDKRQVISNGTH